MPSGLACRAGMVTLCSVLGFVVPVHGGPGRLHGARREGVKQRAVEPQATSGFSAQASRLSVQPTPDPAAGQTRPAGSCDKLPLTFEPNLGQAETRVKFLSRGSGYTLLLTPTEVVLEVPQLAPKSKGQPAHRQGSTKLLPGPAALAAFLKSRAAKSRDSAPLQGSDGTPSLESPITIFLRLKLVGASPRSQMSGLDGVPGRTNYFIGNDPRKWLTNVPNYTRVRYEGVYPGIDLVCYGHQRQLEYDFLVAPGADPGAIRLGIEGATRQDPIARRAEASHLRIDDVGDLRVETDGGEVRFHKPVVYQSELVADSRNSAVHGDESSGDLQIPDFGSRTPRKFLDGRYVLRAANPESKTEKLKYVVGFKVGAYDPKRPLVIDPLLSYSTYLGGHSSDFGDAIAVDSLGNAYVTGYTRSTDFPVTAGAFQAASAGGSTYGDAFVTKLNPAGSAVVYSTYLGGSDDDVGTGIAVDSSGNAYVTGYTRSSNFPTTPGALRTGLGGASCGQAPSVFPCGDAFVAKLNPGGNALLYSTYLGGTQDDWGFGIALDSSTNAYVTGYTESTDFPTTLGAFEPTSSGGVCGADPCPSAFVTKLSPSGSALVYSTYLGGIGGRGYGIAAESSGSAYITGSTDSSSFPTTPGAFQTVFGQNGDAFVVKLKADGSGLLYSTYLGGGGVDAGMALAVDASGNAYVAGLTDSSNFPVTPAALQATCGGCLNAFHDAFVTKLNPAGSSLLYSTFLGGSKEDLAYGIAVDSTGSAYVTGQTFSADFPTSNPPQGTCGGGCSGGLGDAFAARLNATGSTLIYSTYLGGTGNDGAYGIALDPAANAYVTGSTSSIDLFTTLGAFRVNLSGIVNAFVTKIDPPNGPAVTLSSLSLTFPDQAVGTTSSPEVVTLQNVGNMPLAINAVTAGGDFGEAHSCGTNLAPGATCAISITFTPTTTGIRTGAITIIDNSPDGSQTIILSGGGLGMPVATLTPASLGFADQVVGTTSSAHRATLTNSGNAPLNITGTAVAGDFAQTNTCGASVAAGAACPLSVTFTPTAMGTRTGALTLTDNASGSPQVLALTGNGVGAFQLLAGSTSTVIIRGTAMAKFIISASGQAGFTGSIVLACSGQGQVNCVFSPTSLLVGESATLTVSNLQSVTVNALNLVVSGTSGQQSASLSLTISLADFSLSASPAELRVVAGQTSTSTLTLTPIVGFSGTLSLNCAGAPPAANCSLSSPSITLNGSLAAEVTATITTTAPSTLTPLGTRQQVLLPCLLAFAILTSLRFAGRRESARTIGLNLAAIILLVLGAEACAGGGGGRASSNPGTPAGIYTLTVSATYRGTAGGTPLSLTHSATLTLSVS